MNFTSCLADLGIVCDEDKYNGRLWSAIIHYKNAVLRLDDAIIQHSSALSISDRIKRLESLNLSSLANAVKYKERTWNDLLLCTVGKEGIQERKDRQEEWEAQLLVWRDEQLNESDDYVCDFCDFMGSFDEVVSHEMTHRVND
jgi:hypothetical protein